MSDLLYLPSWLNPEERLPLFQAINNMNLEQLEVHIWNKSHMTPRLIGWCNDNNEGYSYSNQVTPVQPWSEALLKVRTDLESEFNVKLPTCLINKYRDGKDSVGWHKDDESIFGERPAVFSLSLGATRRFKMRNRLLNENIDFDLADGDLLIFKNSYVSEWEHCLPKTGKEVDSRINLTFRVVK